MRSDLALLKREAESGTIKPASSTAMLRAASRTFGGGSRMLKYALLGTAALLITVLAAVGAWWFKHGKRRAPRFAMRLPCCLCRI